MRGFLKGLGVFIVVLLIAIVIEAGGLFLSVNELRVQAAIAQKSVEHLQLHIDNSDVKALHQDTLEIDEVLDAVGSELGTWPWTVARAVPVAGEDVQTARDLVDALGTLTEESLPALESLEGISAPDAGTFFDALEAAGGIPGFVEQAQALTDAVAEAAERVSELPKAHIRELQELIDTVDQKLSEADGELDGVRDALGFVGGAVNVVGSLIGA